MGKQNLIVVDKEYKKAQCDYTATYNIRTTTSADKLEEFEEEFKHIKWDEVSPSVTM